MLNQESTPAHCVHNQELRKSVIESHLTDQDKRVVLRGLEIAHQDYKSCVCIPPVMREQRLLRTWPGWSSTQI